MWKIVIVFTCGSVKLVQTRYKHPPQYVGRPKALETSASRQAIQAAVVREVALGSTTAMKQFNLSYHLVQATDLV
jgi:hypothetical protein